MRIGCNLRSIQPGMCSGILDSITALVVPSWRVRLDLAVDVPVEVVNDKYVPVYSSLSHIRVRLYVSCVDNVNPAFKSWFAEGKPLISFKLKQVGIMQLPERSPMFRDFHGRSSHSNIPTFPATLPTLSHYRVQRIVQMRSTRKMSGSTSRACSGTANRDTTRSPCQTATRTFCHLPLPTITGPKKTMMKSAATTRAVNQQARK